MVVAVLDDEGLTQPRRNLLLRDSVGQSEGRQSHDRQIPWSERCHLSLGLASLYQDDACEK
jgi:hypothetical protein